MADHVRNATHDDAEWILQTIAEEERRHRQRHAPGAQDPTAYRLPTRGDVTALLDDANAITLVADRDSGTRGFLLARLVNAPPVYAPGGPVCAVEAFGATGVGADAAEAGATLVREAAKVVRKRDGVLLRIVCSHGDADRANLLTSLGFTVASEWYVGATASATAPRVISGAVRTAVAADLPAILQMADRKRDQYATYQPVFWKKSPAPPETFGPYLASVLANPRTTAVVHEQNGVLDAFLIAAGDYVDDTSVEPESAWHTVGAALLAETAHRAAAKGIPSFTIVCAQADNSKRQTIADTGFRLVTDWYVLDLV